jgi:hypothetical protein
MAILATLSAGFLFPSLARASTSSTEPITGDIKLTDDYSVNLSTGTGNYASKQGYSVLLTPKDDATINIDMSGHDLNLTASSSSLDAYGATITQGGTWNVTNGKGKTITISAEGKDNAYGINMLGTSIDVDANLHIVKAAGTNEAFGIYADMGSKNVFKGDVTIENVALTPDRHDGTYTAGIALWSTGSEDENTSVTVQGKTTIKNSGDAIQIGSKRDVLTLGAASLSINDNSVITDKYHAVTNTFGTVYINIAKDGVTTGTTNIYGDIFNGSTAKTYLALTDADSTWTGSSFARFGKDYAWHGTYLTLQNGATFTNKPLSKDSTTSKSWHGSFLNELTGGTTADKAGNIVMENAGTAPLRIQKISGNTNIFYSHEDSTPAVFSNGNVLIDEASKGANIRVITASNGITTSDTTQVKNVLSALAEKIYYGAKNDTIGDDGKTGNLSGTVEIAEGLTSSSQSLKSTALLFNKDADTTVHYDSTKAKYEPSYHKGYANYEEPKVYKTGVIKTSENIGETREAAADGSVLVASTGKQSDTGTSSAMYAGKDAADNAITVDLQGHDLKLASMITGSDFGESDTVYVGAGKTVHVKNSGTAGSLHITAGRSDFSSTRFSDDAGWGNGIEEQAGGHFTADTDVSIEGIGGMAFQKKGIDTAGSMDFNKDLTIRNVAANGMEGAYESISSLVSKDFNTDSGYGMYVANSKADSVAVNVKGTLDLDNIYGDGIYAENTGKGTTTINTAGITAKDIGRYLVNAKGSTVNLNSGTGITPGTVNATGDIAVYDTAGTEVNMNLTDGSAWTGAVIHLNGTKGAKGAVNLTLGKGSTWTNTVSKYQGNNGNTAASALASLKGEGGAIVQGSRAITVDSYSGNSTVIYKHDADDPTSITGGNFTITKADKDSAITLLTDNSGIDMKSTTADARNRVSEVLNKLAQKLFYTGYTDGNLKGTVEIADGLTASSASLKTGDISYSTATTGTKTEGQGYYDYTPAEDIPSEQTDTEFGQQITGDETKDETYIKAGVLKKGTSPALYKFTKDSTITLAADGTVSDSEKNNGIIRLDGKNADVDATGHTVKLVVPSSTSVGQTPSGIIISGNSNLDFKGNADVSVTGESKAVGVRIPGASLMDMMNPDVVHGGTAVFENGLTVKATAKTGYTPYDVEDNPMGLYVGYKNSSITVKGTTDIDVTSASETNAYGVAVADSEATKAGIKDSAVINLNGDTTIKLHTSHNAYALYAKGGQINVNYDGTGAGTAKVNIDGDLYAVAAGTDESSYPASNTYGEINLAITGSNSSWTGVVENASGKHGDVNLWLTDGAMWTSKASGQLNSDYSRAKDYEKYSYLTTLHGGSTMDKAGIIDMTQGTRGISADNYSGNTLVVYKHEITDNINRVHADLYGNKAANVLGGNFKITDAAAGSAITLVTDNNGVKPTSTAYTDKNLVNDLLDKLANKLYYSGYANGNLKGYVRIAEGLTSSSITKALQQGDISFYNADEAKNAGMAEGQGHYNYIISYPGEQQTDKLSKVILGFSDRDTYYKEQGILKDDGVYHFTKPETTISVDGAADSAEQSRALVYGDNWVAASIYSAISGARPQKNDAGEKISANGQYSNVVMDLGGNKLNVDVNWTGGGTGIAAIGHASKKELNGSVEIKNAGAMSVDLKTRGLSAALFANRGGKITIHNGGGKEEDKVLKLRASSKSKGSAAVIKTMNGNRNAVTKDNTQSEITIDGLVDVLADGKADANGYASNEAVSAVASTINIGGGKIIAKNGAWAAVRAYGEFVTSNYGIVNINAEDRVYGPDKEGSDSYVVKDFNIGKRNVVLEGDVVTNGGMGTKGQINVGLNGASSHWIGNYADTRGYGVTQGMLGSVNIKAKDGAYWKGFGNGSMNVSLTGKDTYWLGFNISQKGKMQLSLNDGATWYNAITKEQKDQDGKAADAYIGYLSGNNGVIDMTGANVFVASSSSLSGNPVKEGDTSITESRNGVTGDVNVDSYSGSHTVVYRHEIVDDAARDHADLYGDKAASVIGGGFKITDAAAGSTITLVTGNTGVSTTSTAYTDKNLVNDLLDKLANKLYYSGYANGNLKGYVRIAEGLTSSSITKALQQGDISFYNADEAKNAGMTEGQGHYSYSLVYPNEQVKDPMATVIDGSRESKDAYRDAGIYKDKTDTYDFTKKPATVNTDGKSDSIIHAGDNDVNVKTNDVLNINAKDGGIGMKAENGKTVTTTGNTNITAKDGTGILADKGIVKLANDTTISAGTGMEAKNGGTITAEGKANITATGNALHADGDGSAIALKDGTISGKVLAENKGTITTNGAAITGDVTAASDGTVSLVNGSTSAGVTADGGTITTDGTEVAGDALAKNSGTVAMTNGKAASVTADGGTVTTNGTEVTGDALAKANGTVSMTNGKAASVTADGGTASTDGTTVDGLISAKDGGTASMKNGSAKGLSADKDSTITATLDKSDAKLDGNVANEGNASISLSNGASWTGDSTGTGTTTANIGSGSTWTGTSSNGNTKVALEGTWKQTGDSTVDTLTGKGGTLDKSTDGAGETKIASYSGNMSILYSHNESTPTEINGAVTTVGQAADGSSISLITDSKGLSMNSRRVNDRNTVSETFNQLAHKLHYTANDGKLAGRLKIAEGLTSSSAALRTENITFDKDGIGTFVYDPAKNDIAIEYGSDETRMMKGTKSALLGSAMMWRSNNNDIQRRMGDLRLGQGETGVWARYMGGKNKYDQQNTYLNQDYDIGQAGFDKKVGDWTVGLAIDHGDGKSHYIGGRGKEKMNTLAIYGTRVSNDGRYFDVIVKTGQVKNKFDVSNEIGNRLHGDYKAWGNSISLEYGKRFVQDSGFYLDPSVEFTAGRLNGKNFRGTSDLGTLYVHQHGFNSAIGRIGFSIGRQLPKSNLYAKLALAHEFAGDFKTDFYADDGGLKSTKVDLSDTWLDMELGGSLSLGKNVYLYGTYTRTFEADMATKWRADVGVRYTF